VIEVSGEPRRYDGDMSSHYHIRCVKCGRIEDVELDRVPDLGSVAFRSGDFRMLSMRLEFEGICRSCSASNGSSEVQRSE
jgi:Fe2+ or Zn2+ uptake regulation protein